MKPLQDALDQVFFAGTLSFSNLSVTPLVSLQDGEPDYLSLDEALGRGDVGVTETSAAGAVPELLFDNRGAVSVLLLDGEELVGGKQNRMLNLSILAPANSTIRIPVSCVEQGRWSQSQARCRTQGRTIYAEGRARKASHVTESLRTSGTRRSRQDEVWNDIRSKSERMGSRSQTQAMASLYDDYEEQIDAYVQRLQPVQNQVGAVFAIGGRVRGIELFDFPATLRRLYPKLVRSYALDALEAPVEPAESLEPDPRAIIKALTTVDSSAHAAVGEGTDLRFSADQLTGGALLARDRLIHLCAFKLAGAPAESMQQPSRQPASRSRNGGSSGGPVGAARSGDRGRAALLAHACGDRFGAPLEFVGDLSVRTRAVRLGNWTDDTHMSLYLGEAILAHGPAPLDADRFGTAVGEAFVRWLRDPLTPTTAPGNTCTAGARNFERHRDWRSSGIASSDGCGAVMRIVPLALAFRGEDLLKAASISARVTHAHPNAEEAAMAGAWLIRQILETGRWGSTLVEAAIRGLEGPWNRGGDVAESLRAAIAWARRGEDWLDERMIPPGDGGWRAGSALGLAVAAALRWPTELGKAVEKAARIAGDSDSVACITGALLGGALGTSAIPSDWLETLPRRTDIANLAEQLAAQGEKTTERRPLAAPPPASPLFVIGDLHGHLDLFELLLAKVDAHYPQARIVTLGDYVDNGPQIPALLDRLIALKAERPERFFPIIGNHDLALLRALGWPNDESDPDWYDRWRMRYWNPHLGTPEAYGAAELKSFEQKFPPAHYQFLASMPWCYDDGRYLCVHAGLHPGPIGPQRVRLEQKALPPEKLFLPDALREKGLTRAYDPAWERVVVSSHTYLGRQAVWSAPQRICVSATSDHGSGLLGVMLPEQRCWRAIGGRVEDIQLG